MATFIVRCSLLGAAWFIQGCSHSVDERYINNLMANKMKRVDVITRNTLSGAELVLLRRAGTQISVVGQDVVENSALRRKEYEIQRSLHDKMKSKELAVMKRLQNRMMQANLQQFEGVHTAAMYSTVLSSQFREQNDYMRKFQELQQNYERSLRDILKQKDVKLAELYQEMLKEETDSVNVYQFDRMILNDCGDPEMMTNVPIEIRKFELEHKESANHFNSEERLHDLALRKYQIERKAHNWLRRGVVQLQEELSRNIAKLNRQKTKELAKREKEAVTAARGQILSEKEAMRRQLQGVQKKLQTTAEENIDRRYARKERAQKDLAPSTM